MIFTTTVEGQDSLFEDAIDAHPLLSRCIELPLARRGLAEAFAKRAHEIADAEGLNGAAPAIISGWRRTLAIPCGRCCSASRPDGR